jgi:uncharacterized membrane protein
VTVAAGIALGLTFALVAAVLNTSSLPVRTRSGLLLLALVAAILISLRQQGAL